MRILFSYREALAKPKKGFPFARRRRRISFLLRSKLSAVTASPFAKEKSFGRQLPARNSSSRPSPTASCRNFAQFWEQNIRHLEKTRNNFGHTVSRSSKVLQYLATGLLISLLTTLSAQNSLEFDGQLSLISSYSPDNELSGFVGGRYIPELSYKVPIDTNRFVDFEASANISGSTLFHPFDSVMNDGVISPYRIWARYSSKQFELRVGLQKIDFGSATLLRPIQWFNQIDPRDPLQLTNGVYGALGRYYFLNNANIWVWALYGNEKTRGFDAIQTNKKVPEIGGRVQYPVSKGEIALSYHHRTANSTHLDFLPQYEKIPEHRVGIDGKFDLKVGLWFEATHSYKTQALGQFTHQSLLNVGTDYTFGLGNGINVIAEHLLVSYDENAFDFGQTANITALTASYPLSFFDNLSTVLYYSWATEDFAFFLNYSHQFKHFMGYFMLYYNPDAQIGVQQNDFVNNFSGPGFRIMLVYNH
jgi:hypothetical protein